MAEEDALAELRRRMDEVQTRHAVDARAAARAFWRSLRHGEGGVVGDAGGHAPGRPDGDGSAAGASSCAVTGEERGSARRGRSRTRRGGAWARQWPPPRGRGLWAHVPPGTVAAQAGDGTDGAPPSGGAGFAVGGVRPREVVWAEGPGDPAEDDLRWADVPDPEPGSVDGLAEVVAVAVTVDAVAGRSLVRHPQGLVQAAVEQVAAARGQQDVILVNLLAELVARGVECPGGLSRTDWLRTLDPGLSAGQAKAFVTVARAVTDPGWAGLAAAVTRQHVTVAQAAVVVQFHERTAPVADPQDLQVAVGDLLEQAPRLTGEGLARLARHHGEQVRPPRDEDRLDAGRQAARGVWFARANATGMVAMRATLDPEAAAVLRSAIDPLAVPRPTTDGRGRTVGLDPRTPARRRADALLDLVERGVAAADGVPVTDKAKLVVTIDHEVLAGQVAGTGLAMSGEVLSAGAVRRLACEAAIVPMVLGGASEPLDVGRERRLVTKGLRVALWQRDGGCSFPGCTVPAGWCDAHHVVPWYLGGRTTLSSMALLCRRHHSHVHRHELTATVTASRVTWHE